MLFVGPQPSTGPGYGLMRRTDPIRRDPLQLRFQPAKLVSASRTTQSLCCAPSPDLSRRARKKPLPVLTSFRRVGLPIRLIRQRLLQFPQQRTRPADASRLRVEFGNQSLKCLLNFSKASSGCCYPDSVVVSVCLCPPLGVCPSVGDCRCRPFGQTCNLRSAPQSIPPTESFST